MFHFPHTHSEICPYLDALEKGRGGVKTILIKLEQNIKDLKPSNCGEVATTFLGNRRTEFRDKFQKFSVLSPKFKRVSLNETPEFPFWGLNICVDFD